MNYRNINKDVVDQYLIKKYIYIYTEICYKMCYDIIRDIISNYGVREFYIGASKDPNNRLLDHRREKQLIYCDCIMKFPDKNLTSDVEKELIKIFGDHPNNYFMINENRPQTSGGKGLTPGINYIYIAYK